MLKIILALTFTLFVIQTTFGQQATHRLRFKYRISQKKINSLAARSIFLREGTATGNPLNLCNDKVLKCWIKNTDGLLTIDPWAISERRINPLRHETDPCYQVAGIVNSASQYPLFLNISRGFARAAGTPVLIGYPTEKVTFPYQTWLIGVNTLAVKFRPSVTDFSGNVYSANAITGTINAGLTLGYSFGWTTFTHRSSSSWSVTPTFALGFSSASLSKEPLKKQIVTTYNPSNFIISPSVGIIIARNEFGLFFNYGHDYMTGKNSNAWAYQGKRFFGIGLSASFKL